MRGVNPYLQLFFASHGLIRYLTNSLLSQREETKRTTVQIHYDLLGETVKFNKATYAVMTKMLSETENGLAKIFGLMTSNIIDSNVFIRSCVLTSFYCSRLGGKGEKCGGVAEMIHKDRYGVYGSLMSSVNPGNISYDNICCMNTLFILLMAHNDRISDSSYDTDMMCTFIQVMDIWHSYYTYRTKELYKLQHSTCVSIYCIFNVYKSLYSEGTQDIIYSL